MITLASKQWPRCSMGTNCECPNCSTTYIMQLDRSVQKQLTMLSPCMTMSQPSQQTLLTMCSMGTNCECPICSTTYIMQLDRSVQKQLTMLSPCMTMSQPSQQTLVTFIRRTHQVLLKLHLTNAPVCQLYKCPVHSCNVEA